MPSCKTKFHGTLSFEPEQVLQLPAGLFGFSNETEFLLVQLPSLKPIVFLQSIRSAHLCFLAMPVQVIDPDYKLALHPQDLAGIGYSEQQPPVMGRELLCLALLTMGEQRAATANLAAPVLIDISAHRGVQVLVTAPYSHQHPVPAPELASRVN